MDHRRIRICRLIRISPWKREQQILWKRIVAFRTYHRSRHLFFFFLSFFFFPFFSRSSPFVGRDSTSSEKSRTRCLLSIFWGEKIYRRNEFAFTRHFWILATHFLDISCIWCTKSHISEARDEERSRLTGETRRVFPYLQHICGSANTALCHSRVIFGPAMGPGEES